MQNKDRANIQGIRSLVLSVMRSNWKLFEKIRSLFSRLKKSFNTFSGGWMAARSQLEGHMRRDSSDLQILG
jgi:hypothetical protein